MPVSLGSLRLIVIVDPDHPELFERLSRHLGDIALVVLDRRRAERRRTQAAVGTERRAADRRQQLTSKGREHLRTQRCRFVYDTQYYGPSSLTEYAPAFCLECERVLEFEVPRFVESPATVETEVRHVFAGGRIQHRVELEALTTAGRALLSCRLDARAVE